MAKALLEHGADPKVADKRGTTPLHLVAHGWGKDLGAELIERGADIGARDEEGVTPLHRAARAGNLEMAELLIARGADVNAKTVEKRRDPSEPTIHVDPGKFGSRGIQDYVSPVGQTPLLYGICQPDIDAVLGVAEDWRRKTELVELLVAKGAIRHIPPAIVVDQQVQAGSKARPAMVIDSRKNGEAYTLEVTQDVIDAIAWHIGQGYAGKEYLFSKNGKFPRWLDSYMRPMRTVQRKLGLRMLGHHAIGRHSVASQAATGGESIKAIQAQLGHRSEQSTHQYAHLGSKAQLRIVEVLKPALPPHAKAANSVVK
jgi:hypothetical protein